MASRLARVAMRCIVDPARLGTALVGGRGDGGNLADGHLGEAESHHRTDQQPDPGERAIATHRRRFAGRRIKK
jgi:hypothetical protein